MPVGCLGDAGRSAGSSMYLSNDQDTSGSGAARQAETFALMQETLLMQIFRCEKIAENGGDNNVSSESDDNCPSCLSFSDQCCQHDSGIKIFQEFQETNWQCFWNTNLVKSISSLRYQGYVCPGILVMLADDEQMVSMKEAWAKKTLMSPRGYKIFRLGISSGCVVTPFLQGQSTPLPDAICWVIARLKQSDVAADMSVILNSLQNDFPDITAPSNIKEVVHAALGGLIKQRKVYYTGKGYFLVTPDNSSVSKSRFGRFVKFRGSGRKAGRSKDMSSQTEGEPVETRSDSASSSSSPNPSSITPPLSNNLRTLQDNRVNGIWTMDNTNKSPEIGANGNNGTSSRTTPTTIYGKNDQNTAIFGHMNGNVGLNMSIYGQRDLSLYGQNMTNGPLEKGLQSEKVSPPKRQSPLNRQSPQHRQMDITPNHSPKLIEPCSSPQNSDTSMQDSPRSQSSNNSSPSSKNTSFNLERSQSLRVSKKSLKNMAKGGSLRVSKNDALQISEQIENEQNDELQVARDQVSPSPPKMERKGSILGKLFGRKKSCSPKKEILTFSAQFPPPDMDMSARTMPGIAVSQTVETQTPPQRKKSQTKLANTPKTIQLNRPKIPLPGAQSTPLPQTPVSTSQVRNGPNGNFVVFERSNDNHVIRSPEIPRAGTQSLPVRSLPQSPPLSRTQSNSPHFSNTPSPQSHQTIYNQQNDLYDAHIYSQLNQPKQNNIYGTSKPPPPAYSSAPPYKPRPPVTTIQALGRKESPGRKLPFLNQSPQKQMPSLKPVPLPKVVQSSSPHKQPVITNSPHKQPVITNSPHKQPVITNLSPQKQVHFAASPEDKLTNGRSSTVIRNTSAPSPKTPKAKKSLDNCMSFLRPSDSSSSSASGPSSLDSQLYDETLIVIEKSNHDLELRLEPYNNASNSPMLIRTQLTNNRVDTIHNNRMLDQEVIFEDNMSDLSRSSSVSTLKPDLDYVPDHPSLSDLGSIADLSANFKSLTARKLMAGLSISSIDTLLEVNAACAADNKKSGNKLDESTETIDFGVI